MMQCVGRRYVAHFNKRHDRTGTLWEGRFRATVVDSERYLFTCYRYIELNPVRAGVVAEPAQYRWSSFAANALGVNDPLITPHNRYAELGASPKRRQEEYGTLFEAEIPPADVQYIRSATNKGWALGGDAFRIHVTRTDRRAYPLARWRDMANE